jgi:hypothetical protein
MIIHLATGQPVQLHIHTEDGGPPPLIIAGLPAPVESSLASTERGRTNRLVALALVAATFGLGGYYLAPASRATSPAPVIATSVDIAPTAAAPHPPVPAVPPAFLREMSRPPVVTPPPAAVSPAGQPATGNAFGLE